MRKRFHTAKNRLNLTLAQVGKRINFSGPFMSQLLRDKDPARMRTKHVERLASALEQLEREARLADSGPSEGRQVESIATAGDQSLEDLIRLAHRLGFEVSFKPLNR